MGVWCLGNRSTFQVSVALIHGLVEGGEETCVRGAERRSTLDCSALDRACTSTTRAIACMCMRVCTYV